MTHSHSYNITANYLISCICYKGINDILNDRKMGEAKKDKAVDDLFKAQLMKLKKMGIHKWLYAHKHTMDSICAYFTKAVGTIVPITELQVEGC